MASDFLSFGNSDPKIFILRSMAVILSFCAKVKENEEVKNFLEGLNLKSDQGFFLEAYFIPRAGHATTPI